MNHREAMRLALEALVTCCAEEWRTLNNFGMKQVYDEKKVNAAIAALHAALAEPECYDQTALELCGVCGWRTLIPNDACLNCERAKPEQEPWSTPGRFYEQIDRAVEDMRQRMLIKAVTMRCKDFDLALPIIYASDGHVLVAGTAPTPRKPLTDEEVRKHLAIAKSHEQTWLMFARAIERAHGITGETE